MIHEIKTCIAECDICGVEIEFTKRDDHDWRELPENWENKYLSESELYRFNIYSLSGYRDLCSDCNKKLNKI